MEIQMPYGREQKALRLPPGTELDYITPAAKAPLPDVAAAFEEASHNPVGEKSLHEIAPDSRVTIVIADLTRAKGTDTLLPLLVEMLRKAGVPAGNVNVLVARGTHRKLTKEEREFFRSGAMAGVKVSEHDCDDPDKMSALLLTRRGTPVRVNNAVKDVDATILLSPLSFHYFAGFGGGRKLVLPGSADRAAIVANHRLSLTDTHPVKLQPECRAGNMYDNPVHEDMLETLAALRNIYGVNYFNDIEGNIIFINTGDPVEAHLAAADAYSRVYEPTLSESCGVMLMSAGGYPYDMNFLQAHKALRNAAGALSEKATLLYYASCEEGVGSPSLEAAITSDHRKFLNNAYDDYHLNNQTAVSLLDLTHRFEIGMVSSMNVDTLLAAGVKPCLNPESFLAEALEKHNTTRVTVVKNGSALLPHFSEGDRT